MNYINVGYDSTNCFAISSQKKYLLIDVGMPSTMQKLIHSLNKAGIDIKDISHVICTHYHPDHCGIVQNLQEMGVELVITHIQASLIDNANKCLKKFPEYKEIIIDPKSIIAENDRDAFFDRLGLNGYLVHTPGHSEDSISIVIDGLGVFTGDLPVYGLGIGHSKSEDEKVVLKSWDIIKNTGGNRIFPAHAGNFQLFS